MELLVRPVRWTRVLEWILFLDDLVQAPMQIAVEAVTPVAPMKQPRPQELSVNEAVQVQPARVAAGVEPDRVSSTAMRFEGFTPLLVTRTEWYPDVNRAIEFRFAERVNERDTGQEFANGAGHDAIVAKI